MRLMHLADLHIGKRVNGFSMLEDQRYVLEQVLNVAEKQELDGVIVAGDIYDKPIPSGEAVQLLDWFLTGLAKLQLPVYMISGNHDSGERLSFGATLLERSGVYVTSLYDGELQKLVLEDAYGTLNLYLLPFVKPAQVRRVLERESATCGNEVTTYDEAIGKVIEQAKVDGAARNVLVAHQFVTGAVRCESEELSVGGVEQVSAEHFDAFDYVALGHIHGPQSMTRQSIRYAGTLLKYSFSECHHKKVITIVELREKGDVSVETIPISPFRDMQILQEQYQTLMSREYYAKLNCEDYTKIILTDAQEIPEVMGRLRTVYPNIMALEYAHLQKESQEGLYQSHRTEQKSPLEQVRDFYALQQGKVLKPQQEDMILDMMKEIWGE